MSDEHKEHFRRVHHAIDDVRNEFDKAVDDVEAGGRDVRSDVHEKLDEVEERIERI